MNRCPCLKILTSSNLSVFSNSGTSSAMLISRKWGMPRRVMFNRNSWPSRMNWMLSTVSSESIKSCLSCTESYNSSRSMSSISSTCYSSSLPTLMSICHLLMRRQTRSYTISYTASLSRQALTSLSWSVKSLSSISTVTRCLISGLSYQIFTEPAEAVVKNFPFLVTLMWSIFCWCMVSSFWFWKNSWRRRFTSW